MVKILRGALAGVAAAVLLTGCGSDSGDSGESARRQDKASTSQAASPTTKADGVTHEVTLQVTGSGSTQVLYKAKSNGFGKQKLPWTKTETVELTEAEQKVGYLVSVVPGSVPAADGMMKRGGCVIKVDGKKVADNDDGKSSELCEYKIH
ncbi:hypothetical protein AB0L85_00940 [Streptomyces sp. NPDC052051]|uniref:hypothetical protein n=1 Tax=Streptomyces sp. NPDC052051 TaxID=3154649 RepID=UPI00342B6580